MRVPSLAVVSPSFEGNPPELVATGGGGGGSQGNVLTCSADSFCCHTYIKKIEKKLLDISTQTR